MTSDKVSKEQQAQEQAARAFIAWQDAQNTMSRSINWNALMDQESEAAKDPKNYKVSLGPVLTEEQFKLMMERQHGGQSPVILRPKNAKK